MYRRHVDCSRACALEDTSKEPSLGAGKTELERWVEVLETECYGLLTRITMAIGASQKACYCALPDPASAGQEEEDPA